MSGEGSTPDAGSEIGDGGTPEHGGMDVDVVQGARRKGPFKRTQIMRPSFKSAMERKEF